MFSWDEWISEARVLKYTDENLQKQKQLKEMNSKRKPSRASSSTAVASSLNDNSSVTESRSRKRHRDSSIDKARLVGLYTVKESMVKELREDCAFFIGRRNKKTRIQIDDTRYIKRIISG